MKEITQVMAEVVQSIRNSYETEYPHFMYGYKKDIARKLVQKDRDRVNKFLKFPLIVLWLNTPNIIQYGVHHYTLHLGIYDRSKAEFDTAQKRMESVVRPKLEPVYNQLIEAFNNYEMFWEGGDLTSPPHTKLSSPYGQQESGGVVRNIFGDHVDAIELVDLRINLLETCDEFSDLNFLPSPPPQIEDGSLVFFENGKWFTITLEELHDKLLDVETTL